MFGYGSSVLAFRPTSWLSDPKFSRLEDAVEDGSVEIPARLLDTKFLTGLDLAAILSSQSPSCNLFDMAWEQHWELKRLMLNKHRRWFHSSRVKFPFGLNVCELIFWVDVFGLDLGVQINSIEQPVKSNSVGSGNMSQCRTSAFDDHLDHSFVVFKDVQHGSFMRRIRV